MKRKQYIFLIIIILIISIPLIFLNCTGRDKSKMENRTLQEFPTLSSQDLTGSIERYFSDRIGFRDECVSANMYFNDSVFSKLEHPLYMYGKSGNIFKNIKGPRGYISYDSSFANFVIKASRYLKAKDIEFMFVFNPSKASVMNDRLPYGMNYDCIWKDQIQEVMKKEGINCVDNTDTLILKHLSGESVFNKKYDIFHWNDLGAFYGVNNIIENIVSHGELLPNSKDEFNIEVKSRKELPLSRYEIDEKEEVFLPKSNIENLSSEYDGELYTGSNHSGFGYYVNQNKLNKKDRIPKILVFQGSYMNGMGEKFLKNAFYEYVFVNGYDNLVDMDYYVNIFKPDLVILDVEEDTFLDGYGYESNMTNKVFNVGFNRDELSCIADCFDKVIVTRGKKLTKIVLKEVPSGVKDMYLEIGGNVYDVVTNVLGEKMVTIMNEDYSDDISFYYSE